MPAEHAGSVVAHVKLVIAVIHYNTLSKTGGIALNQLTVKEMCLEIS